jgi:hypothetical protein
MNTLVIWQISYNYHDFHMTMHKIYVQILIVFIKFDMVF